MTHHLLVVWFGFVPLTDVGALEAEAVDRHGRRGDRDAMERCGGRVDLEEVDPVRARVEGVHELVGIYLGPLRLEARPCAADDLLHSNSPAEPAKTRVGPSRSCRGRRSHEVATAA